jgi:hypothetical protein
MSDWKNPDLEVIKKAYGWTIGNNGEVFGLVAGDMGYELTNIEIPIEHLEAWALYNYKNAEIERLREELNAYKEREKTPPRTDDQ